jgi:glucosamine 6-phosphate synthetase-like amidotransferase/phosphosugar isomerase protein
MRGNWQALQYAKKRGAFCIGLTNTVGSAIARLTDCGVHINAGCEIGVASTKAYTSQMVAITMMALALSEDSISKRSQRDEIIDELGLLPEKVRQVRCRGPLVTHISDKESTCVCVCERGGGSLQVNGQLVQCDLL